MNLSEKEYLPSGRTYFTNIRINEIPPKEGSSAGIAVMWWFKPPETSATKHGVAHKQENLTYEELLNTVLHDMADAMEIQYLKYRKGIFPSKELNE